MIFYNFLKDVGIAGFIDIAIMSILFYSILVWMKRTKRAASIITGIIIVAIVFLIARQFNLLLTAAILQGFFAVILVALIVIFQEELRYFFEKVTHWSFSQRLSIKKKQKAMPSRHRTTDVLVRTLMDLARDKVGALVVFHAKDSIYRHLEGGEPLNGAVSEKVLKSIFDPHSIGHDGAVVIEGETIRSFSCHLPLSKNHEALKEVGTRHAAALGLSELTDALCIAVSEERGVVSVARHGRIEAVHEADKLSQILDSFFLEAGSDETSQKWRNFFKRNYREKALGLGLAIALWFVLVYGADTVFKTYEVPIEKAELSADLIVKQTIPANIAVTLSGQRKLFYLTDEDDVRVILKPWQLKKGTTVIPLLNSNFSIPEGLTYESAEPQEITVIIESKDNAESKK